MDDKLMTQVPLIWDADGSPDSVVALLYFLRHPKFRVEAITVSCGQAHPEIFAAKLTQMLKRVGWKGIPVAAGRPSPLAGDNAFPDPWRKLTDEFWGIELPEADETVQSSGAVALISQVLSESDDPVAIFVSGTHTNLAEVLRKTPALNQKISSVEVMGGALFIPGNIHADWPEMDNKVSEWNIWVDPVAAGEVFSAGLDMYITPLDTTHQVLWTEDDAEQWDASGTEEGKMAAEILRSFLAYVGSIEYISLEGFYLWDLLAAVNASDRELCTRKQVHIEVVTAKGDDEGRTVVFNDRPPNATAFLSPNVDGIKACVREVLGK